VCVLANPASCHIRRFAVFSPLYRVGNRKPMANPIMVEGSSQRQDEGKVDKSALGRGVVKVSVDNREKPPLEAFYAHSRNENRRTKHEKENEHAR
jgi:hypothetical protein